MADELAARRQSRPSGSYLNEDESRSQGPKNKDGSEKAPPLWRWFSAQAAHSIPERAAAAKHVRERFNLAFSYFSKIDRALAEEDSEHLIGFRELLDEYRVLFNIADDDDEFARQTGVGGKMLPVGIERCERCKRESIPGTGLCARHGGQWISEKDVADISRRNHERILVLSGQALRALEDLLDNAKSEQVRMQTAMVILDRAGFGAHVNINHSGSVTVESRDEATTILQTRLATLAANVAERAELEARLAEADGLGDIVEAEVVAEVLEG